MEQGTALALLVIPLAVGQLFFGCAELTGVVISVAQVTGIVLIALGVACWPSSTALYGMLTYSTIYLGYMAVGDQEAVTQILIRTAFLINKPTLVVFGERSPDFSYCFINWS